MTVDVPLRSGYRVPGTSRPPAVLKARVFAECGWQAPRSGCTRSTASAVRQALGRMRECNLVAGVLVAPFGQRFVFGAPAFAPLLFADLAILAALGLWAQSRARRSFSRLRDRFGSDAVTNPANRWRL
jgi:hypothetical protein